MTIMILLIIPISIFYEDKKCKSNYRSQKTNFYYLFNYQISITNQKLAQQWAYKNYRRLIYNFLPLCPCSSAGIAKFIYQNVYFFHLTIRTIQPHNYGRISLALTIFDKSISFYYQVSCRLHIGLNAHFYVLNPTTRNILHNRHCSATYKGG